MSGTELLVITVCLFIGYWAVASFGSSSKEEKTRSRDQDSPPSENQHQQKQSEREEQEWKSKQQRGQETRTERPVPWYEVLNVSPSAHANEIRRAYRNLMSQYHPDKVASLGPELRDLSERKTKEINTAYDRAMAERGTVC